MISLSDLHEMACSIRDIDDITPDREAPNHFFVCDYGLGRIGNLYFSHRGLKQFCTFMNVPYRYLIRCTPDLQELNLNAWMKRNRRDYVFRVSNGYIEAVVTPSYTDIPHYEVTEKLIDYDWGNDPPEVRELSIDKFDFSAYLIWPNTQVHSDSLVRALRVYNNRAAEAALSVRAGIYRLVCSNGLVLPIRENYFKQIHKGKIKLDMQIGEVAKEFDLLRNWDRPVTSKKEVEFIYRRLSPNVPADLRRNMKKEFEECNITTIGETINYLTSNAKKYTPIVRSEIEEGAGKLLLIN